jgi:moderate conductance mechanosensitive channel
MVRFASPRAGRLIDMRLMAFRLPMFAFVPLAAFAFVLLAAGSVRAAPPTPPAEVPERVAHLRELLASEQGAAILDLLGDPRVRQAIIQDPDSTPQDGSPSATAGEMMADMLGGLRTRLWNILADLNEIPDQMTQVLVKTRAQLPIPERLRLIGAVIVFLAGGIVGQSLFFRLARPWRMHFGAVTLDTARERARVVSERLLIGMLVVASFAAGSMGAFLLFAWPPLTGSIILGYLLAFVLVRLSLAATRFFLAPGADRMRLVPVNKKVAWFWHRWSARLVGTAAIGWQTIVTLRTLGMPQAGTEVLLQLLLLVLTCLGIVIVWSMPRATGDAASSTRGPVPRLLVSLALLLDWLLFLMGASALGWTLLIFAAAPIATFVLGRSVCTVAHGQVPEPDVRQSPYRAIGERFIQAAVVLTSAAILVHVWQIDMTAMSAMDTPMTRIARGLLEALVILVIADLLWQVVRVMIDRRLAGAASPIDDLDDDERRRRARLYTLLPVLRNFALFIVLVMASLSALAAMGLQIGPLLAGAGVVGIAIGFGAQTLVRDILSGIFFLLDDAFRVGESIESGGIRGTVESFSLRSVKLRHLNGQLHTVPFGDLKAITNYSRDWVVETLHLVVTYDTDLDLLEDVVAAVSAELMADPVLGPEMIEPLRSLGVQAMVDMGIQIGMMFKTRPGRQFAVRSAVFSRIKLAFAARGIRIASTLVLPHIYMASAGPDRLDPGYADTLMSAPRG